MSEESAERTVVITGGAGALGRHVVRRFLREGHAVHVPLFGPEEGAELRDFLGSDDERLHLHPDADLASPRRVADVFAAVRDAGGGPDVLLNLAGGFRMAPVEDTSPEAWEGMLRANATTAFLASREAFPGMKRRGRGRIVNVAALPVLDEGAGAGFSAYGAAKAAVMNLTRTLAREGVAHGITVNAILPSIIDTPANRSAMPEADTSAWVPPGEVAGVCAFLASEEARTVTGAALTLRLD